MDDFLEIVEMLMTQGYSESVACREAYAILNPDCYDCDDYETW